MRTVDIEIVRTGDPHNQLLSPLVSYMALCGKHPSVRVSVTREHRKFLDLLRPLQDPEHCSPRDRQYAIGELSELVSALLDPVRGIDLELAACDGDLVELRLVLTPQELNLLPFELLAFDRVNSAFGRTVRNAGAKVVLTRGIRGVGTHAPSVSEPGQLPQAWPVVPKILFVVASPGGLAPPPYREHLLALRQALEPWLPPTVSGAPDTGAQLTILSNATLHDIAAACRKTRFDFVHFLVHGGRTSLVDRDGSHDEGRNAYGIVLEGREGPDVVDGRRLFEALRPGERPSTPSMVTLCTCHSGRGQDVLYPGGSVAQELHASGIPFVVASQFPLTFKGSVHLTEELYGTILQGSDPRVAVAAIRERLDRAILPGSHPDHASVVAYSDPAPDFDNTVAECRSLRAYQMMAVAQKWFKRAKAGDPAGITQARRRLDDAIVLLQREEALLQAKHDEWLRRAQAAGAIQRPPFRARAARWAMMLAEIQGLIGSAYKRISDTQRLEAGVASPASQDEFLRLAHEAYGRAAAACIEDHWSATQWLVLEVVRNGTAKSEQARDRWNQAMVGARRDPHVWQHGTLAELHLIRPLVFDDPGDEWKASCRDQVDQLVRRVREGTDLYPIKSTRAQFERYEAWGAGHRGWEEVIPFAKTMAARLAEGLASSGY